MAIDWLAIKSDYVNGGGSYRELAKKHGLNKDTIAKKAKAEDWGIQKGIQTDKIQTAIIQKTAEQISDAHATALSHISNVAEKVVLLAEKAVDSMGDKKAIPVDDLAKIAKILKDAKDTQTAILPPGTGPLPDDGFIEALNAEASEIWEGGDDAPD